MSLWEVGVSVTVEPAQLATFQQSPMPAEAMCPACALAEQSGFDGLLIARRKIGVETDVPTGEVQVTLQKQRAEEPAGLSEEQRLCCLQLKDLLELL